MISLLRYSIPFLLLLLVACSTSTPTGMTYVIPNPPLRAHESADSPSIVVREVQLAEYVNQGGFVIRTSDVEITVTHQNRWGESIENGIERYLNRILYHPYPVNAAPSAAYQLQITFDAFESIRFETAVVGGSWSLYRPWESQAFRTRRFHLTEPVSPQNYSGIVNAYARLLAAIATDIGQQADQKRE